MKAYDPIVDHDQPAEDFHPGKKGLVASYCTIVVVAIARKPMAASRSLLWICNAVQLFSQLSVSR